ncbi:MAG: DUF4331 domain-containing protein [Actinomycetota bacterium]
MASLRKRGRRALALVATAALSAGLFAGLGPVSGGASSHREAPLITDDPKADNTDVWVFVPASAPDTVAIIGSWIPLEEPAGGPNFYPWGDDVAYDVNIDNDGDARANIIYRWVFSSHYENPDTFLYATGPVTSLDDPDLNFRQTYDLFLIEVGSDEVTQLLDDAPAVPSDVGAGTMPEYAPLFEAGVTPFDEAGEEGLTWAGQSDDAFFLDLRVFDLLYGGDLSERFDDTLAGFNVNTIALEVSKDDLALGGDAEENPIIGIWSSTSRRSTRVLKADGSQTHNGRFVQVSRLGMALVNEVVIPVGEKDRFNASKPKDDGQFLSLVTDPEVPHLVEALYGIPAPDSDPATPGIQRDDLVAVFLTGVSGLNQPTSVTPSEMLRLNMSIPPSAPVGLGNRLGVIDGDVAGYPNGRRLEDDVIDITLNVAEGDLLDGAPFVPTIGLSDGVDTNDVPFLLDFPYVAMPHRGSDIT